MSEEDTTSSEGDSSSEDEDEKSKVGAEVDAKYDFKYFVAPEKMLQHSSHLRKHSAELEKQLNKCLSQIEQKHTTAGDSEDETKDENGENDSQNTKASDKITTKKKSVKKRSGEIAEMATKMNDISKAVEDLAKQVMQVSGPTEKTDKLEKIVLKQQESLDQLLKQTANQQKEIKELVSFTKQVSAFEQVLEDDSIGSSGNYIDYGAVPSGRNYTAIGGLETNHNTGFDKTDNEDENRKIEVEKIKAKIKERASEIAEAQKT